MRTAKRRADARSASEAGCANSKMVDLEGKWEPYDMLRNADVLFGVSDL
jgi:hypothetical protein